ncbi:MAG: hypothetical protein RLZZ623_1011, partial [Actinomycetota bacterium]
GIGMVVICAKADAGVVQASIAERTWLIGSLIPGLPRTHDTSTPGTATPGTATPGTVHLVPAPHPSV